MGDLPWPMGMCLGVLLPFLKKKCFERGFGAGTGPRRAGLSPGDAGLVTSGARPWATLSTTGDEAQGQANEEASAQVQPAVTRAKESAEA